MVFQVHGVDAQAGAPVSTNIVYPWELIYAAATFGQLDRLDDARQCIVSWRAAQPTKSLLAWPAQMAFACNRRVSDS